ncbi:MAG: hypothetical protein BWY30_01046 [Tenericutes bacterium ADurb.Bin239]|jgi:hypothetical protein|nr:MAG: hypothetical protein BWY30_01046 [Tenericutes bacterium ADurb.Bin239]
MSDIARIFIAILIMAVLIGLYIGSYVLNKRTKKPEGCEEIASSCTGCAVTTCSHNPSKEE